MAQPILLESGCSQLHVQANHVDNHLEADVAGATADGDLYTVGANDSHQLGTKAGEAELSLIRVEPLESHAVQHVAVGEGHMLAIVDNGQLASWGVNDHGETGQPFMIHR